MSNAKQILKNILRTASGLPGVYQLYRLPSLHAAPVHINDARRRLEAISPRPPQRTNAPSFKYEADPNIEISIILPCYNVEDYVGDCIRSILAQKTSHTFEIIAVNDGSTDGTLSVLRSLAKDDSRIVIIDQHNKGPAGARNTGVDNMRGQYLLFVDSDDALAPEYLEHMMHALRNGDCDYVSSSYTYVDEDGKPMFREYPRTLDTAWGRLFPRTIWQRLRFPEGYLFEDMLQAFCITPRYRELAIKDFGYLYRYRSSSISHALNVKSIDTYWIVEELLHDCRKARVPFDQRLYDTTIHHLGQLMYWRTRNFPPEQQQILFSVCCDLLGSIPEFSRMRTTLTGCEKDVERSLRTGNYRLWKASCLFLNLQTL
ncbi:glycosyltransferase family 2 protein [Bifidobacterium subtile]|uniref:Glycosyl transferase family 2 n=1 Tax=Bifidobacterium subtile TaxID=77635 RepID=A0A087DSZ1_9BIFI|nr:glycosyltransferase family 2 protein [Bifidobacterium subtile]KFI98641.1 glycosyl transferase family 2 [Bifidobacterium subtile]QOL36719.1 glycosyltransferase family 2 protein [Bifidobacterium subtile]